MHLNSNRQKQESVNNVETNLQPKIAAFWIQAQASLQQSSKDLNV